MTKHLFKLKEDGKTVGLIELYQNGNLRLQYDGTSCPWTHICWPQHLSKFLEEKKVTSTHPFVCKDKNGKDVFAGDRIKRVPYEGDPNPKPYQTEGRTGTVAWHHGFLQWCFLDDRTHHLDDLVDSEIFEAGIELIVEDKNDD